MGAAPICVELQAILVMFLLFPPPFLPSVLAAGISGGGKSGKLVAGGRETPRKPPARSLRFLFVGVPSNPGGKHDPPVNYGRRGR
ncbi:hypothetical protein E2562_019823 [Oryza meyeriana var. granulata]|uniref:Secreted protein n=1 Tax=Oryza meyeriana var. granulata TaxID=110450 RepID=A0A6G1DKW6_9ORYZ|nr:hypothetical protein E2562_019823 [Oryza meyeriana var. granulata]